MQPTTWEPVLEHKSLLGEGPVWDETTGRIIWLDIKRGHIHEWDLAERQHIFFEAGQMVGAVALRKQGGLIAALQHGFALIDTHTKHLEMIADTEALISGNRFNDGKCDPRGRFWAGTMSITDEQCKGNLYTLETDGPVVLKIAGVSCSNGLAWSPDQKTMYYIDTPTKEVVAYDYNIEDGSIHHKRTVITIPDGDGLPDGMTIDTEGMLWIALWDGWKVQRWDPLTGKKLYQIELPVARITSCTFGGEDLDDLYITSASTGLTAAEQQAQPLAGSLFVVKHCGFRGMPATTFNDQLPPDLIEH